MRDTHQASVPTSRDDTADGTACRRRRRSAGNARRRSSVATEPELLLWQFPGAARNFSMDVYDKQSHGVHRAVGLRQIDLPAHAEPDERDRPAQPRGRRDPAGQRKHFGAWKFPNLRRRVGMVFQKSNPFPKSIFDNIAYGPRINGIGTGPSWRDRVEAQPAPRGAVGRSEGQAASVRLRASPAASSSGCASRARWR